MLTLKRVELGAQVNNGASMFLALLPPLSFERCVHLVKTGLVCQILKIRCRP
jgi:hypothetical protein